MSMARTSSPAGVRPNVALDDAVDRLRETQAELKEGIEFAAERVGELDDALEFAQDRLSKTKAELEAQLQQDLTGRPSNIRPRRTRRRSVDEPVDEPAAPLVASPRSPLPLSARCSAAAHAHY